jgi:hypothetical protein
MNVLVIKYIGGSVRTGVIVAVVEQPDDVSDIEVLRTWCRSQGFIHPDAIDQYKTCAAPLIEYLPLTSR